MKKTLLFLAASFISVATFAQTSVTMAWNSYGAGDPIIDYQGKETTLFADYTPVVGNVVSITLEGTADQDITDFQVAIVDDAPPSYWTELAGFKPVEINASNEFSVTLDFTITAEGNPKVVFDGKNATLAGEDGTGTAIELTLSEYSYSVFSPIKGALTLTDNGQGKKQLALTLPQLATETLEAGQYVNVSFTGTSDVDFSEFQVCLVDESEDAATSYWSPLSDIINFTPAEGTAGTEFTATASIPVTAAAVGTSEKKQNIVLMAASDAKFIQLVVDPTSYVITVTDEEPTTSGDETTDIDAVEADVVSIKVLSTTGVVLETVESVSELAAGVYILEVTYADGSVKVQKLAK